MISSFSLTASAILAFSLVLTACPSSQSSTSKANLPENAPVTSAAPATAAIPKNVAASATSQNGQQLDGNFSKLEVTKPNSESEENSIPTRISGTITVTRFGMVSFISPGHIAKLHARVGDRVKKGQTLAQLNDADFILRERMAAVAVQQAKIQFDQAKKDLAREEQLKQENVTSVAALERMTNGFQAAKLGLEQAQITLEMANKAVKDSRLDAPFDGIVTKKIRSEGEWVGGGAPVLELYEAADLEISLKIPEALLKKAQIGKSLTISVPSTGVKATAKIIRVVPIVMESTRTFEVTAQFTKPGTTVFPGQFVEADLN